MGRESVPFDAWFVWWNQNPFAVSVCAGAVAGVATEAAVFPVDCLKTRLQSPRGFWSSGGFRGLYAGLPVAMLGCAPASAIFFTTFEGSKKVMKKDADTRLRPHHIAIASMIGELCACVIRVPTELMKQRFQVQAAMNLAQAAQDLRGLRINQLLLSISFRMTACRDVVFSGLQFPIYESLKHRRFAQTQSASWADGALCGSVAGALSGFLTTPLDRCKTHVMLGVNSLGAEKKVLEVLREVYEKEGHRGFWKGCVPRCTWMGAGGFIFLGTYDVIKDGFGKR